MTEQAPPQPNPANGGDQAPPAQQEQRPEGLRGRITNMFNRIGTAVRDRLAFLPGINRREEEPQEQEQAPQREQLTYEDGRYLHRDHLAEGVVRAQNELAGQMARDRLVDRIIDGENLDPEHRAIRGEAQRNTNFDPQTVRTEIQNELGEGATREQEAQEFNNRQNAALRDALNTEIDRRRENGTPQQQTWIEHQLEPTQDDIREAENLVPDVDLLRFDIRRHGGLTRDEDRIHAAELAYQHAYDAAREAAADRERARMRDEFGNLPDNERHEMQIEATRRIARRMLEDLEATDPQGAADHLRDQQEELVDAIERDFENLDTEEGRAAALRRYVNFFLGEAFDNDQWVQDVHERFENAPAGANPAETVLEMLNALHARNATHEEIATALLYAAAYFAPEVQAQANEDAREAAILGFLISSSENIHTFDNLVDHLIDIGVFNNQTVQEYQANFNQHFRRAIDRDIQRVFQALNYNRENNPAFQEFLRHMTENMGEDAVLAFIAADFLFDLGNDDGNGLNLRFENRGGRFRGVEVLGQANLADAFYNGNALDGWIHETFENVDRNPELMTEIEEMMLVAQYGDDYLDQMPLDAEYISDRQARREMPGALRELDEGERAEMIAAMMRELGMTREQALRVLETSERSWWRDLFKGPKPISQMVRGTFGAIASSMGMMGLMLGATSVAPALGLPLAAALGLYSTVRFFNGAFRGLLGMGTGAIQAGRALATGRGEFIDYTGNVPWGNMSRFDRNNQERTGCLGRVSNAVRFFGSRLVQGSLLGTAAGLAVGGGAAFMIGPSVVFFTPLVLIGGKIAKGLSQARARAKLNQELNQFRENPGPNMQRVIQEMAADLNGDDGRARELLREKLLGRTKSYYAWGKLWNSFGTAYTVSSTIGAAVMGITGTETGLERLQGDQTPQPAGETGAATGEGAAEKPGTYYGEDETRYLDRGPVGEPTPTPTPVPTPTPPAPTGPMPAGANTVGHIVRGHLGEAAKSGVTTAELWNPQGWAGILDNIGSLNSTTLDQLYRSNRGLWDQAGWNPATKAFESLGNISPTQYDNLFANVSPGLLQSLWGDGRFAQIVNNAFGFAKGQ